LPSSESARGRSIQLAVGYAPHAGVAVAAVIAETTDQAKDAGERATDAHFEPREELPEIEEQACWHKCCLLFSIAALRLRSRTLGRTRQASASDF